MTPIHEMHTAATIGVFDGLHLGHRHLVDYLVELAHERNLEPVVITFHRHPASIIPGKTPPGRLIPNEEKHLILKSWGIYDVISLDFDSQMASMTSKDFLDYIHDKFGVRMLLVGFNHKFGSDRQSSLADYIRYGKEVGVEVIEATRFPHADVSSSAVRALIKAGDVAEAGRLLDSYYTLRGTVVEGYRNGTKLGFPTANIKPAHDDMLIPANGVYAVWASVAGGDWLPAVCNIGFRPSVSPDGKATIEVHILDFNADIYGASIKVQFVKRMRAEMKFDGLDLLKQQLARDCDDARAILTEN
ncbi:MAG: riboflavin biosynthesis protein RibF [Muribaculaceae bacterium]|nr:riboflavin biosynthesis protein RibF [Muribaculaceae bacterium]